MNSFVLYIKVESNTVDNSVSFCCASAVNKSVKLIEEKYNVMAFLGLVLKLRVNPPALRTPDRSGFVQVRGFI